MSGTTRSRRADAERSLAALLAAAADVFVADGVDAPVRAVAARAGVGVGTIYRHFPTRADLVVAVYRHQVEELAASGAAAAAAAVAPLDDLRRWVHRFTDFLVTKHGLASAVSTDDATSGALHALLVERLVPTCGALLDAAESAGLARPGTDPYQLLRGIGNLCIGAEGDPRYDARRLVDLLLDGLRHP